MNNQTTKRKRTAGETPQQPQMNDDRAATLTQTRGEFSSGAVGLQEEMKTAAMKLVELDEELEEQIYDPANKKIPIRELEYGVFASEVHCIPNGRGKPATVFCRLNDKWLQATTKTVTEAFMILNPTWELEKAELIAKFLLRGIRDFCKDVKKVSWTLPRIKSQEGSASK